MNGMTGNILLRRDCLCSATASGDIKSAFPRSRAVRGVLLKLLMAAVLAMLVLAISAAAPQYAHATFKDVATSYPALQEVTASGEVYTADEIPDGEYSVTMSASSYMCKFTNCKLIVQGNDMAIRCNVSKAYTAFFIGTAEEAAAQTDATGDDESAYFFGDPKDGYAERVIVIPIPALNEIFNIATFNGGTKSHADAVWYTRQIVFHSSVEIEMAVDEARAAGEAEKENAGKQEEKKPSSSSKSNEGNPGSSGSGTSGSANAGENKSDDDAASSGKSGSKDTGTGAGTGNSTGNSTGSGSTTTRSGNGADGAKSDSAAPSNAHSSQPEAKAENILHGIPFSLVDDEMVIPKLLNLEDRNTFEKQLVEFLPRCITLEIIADVVAVLLVLAVLFLVRARSPKAFGPKRHK